MTLARWGALTIGLLALLGAGLGVERLRQDPQPLMSRPLGDRPALLLLSSLPMLFGEDFSLSGGSPVLKSLETRYRVLPISVTSPAELAKASLLLIAQPLAQTPENLVALDDWVRRGGRALLFTDPLLEWPSARPLGDLLRPPPMFADTGLLAHWGLRLDAPDKRGPAVRSLAGYKIVTVSPGSLQGRCAISEDRLVADCKLGNGRAIVIADADLLDVADLGSQAVSNVPAILSELAKLEKH